MPDTAGRRIRRDIGLGVVGSGRIGSLRALLANRHPAVRFLAVADRDAAAAEALADNVGADLWTGTNDEVIAHPEVTAVVVATSEGAHVDAVLEALALDKPALVEKPIALSLEDADRMVGAAEASAADLRVGYSRRFKRRYHAAKEQVGRGRLGELLGATARVYNSRTQALAMLDRNPGATPVVDALTYYVDLVGWFFEGQHVTEVTAMGRRGVLEAHGHDTDDLTWALLRMSGGAAVSLGVSYALPAGYPSRGHAARFELLGTDGVLLVDDDHTDQIMYTDHGMPHVYLSDEEVNAVFLSSGTPGDWALGEFIGPLAAETRAWLDHLATGGNCNLASAAEARATLATTLAIEEAAETGRRITPS